MIKTFRGQLADGGQDQIRLQTIKGKVGYRIVKFQIMNPQAGASAYEMESTIKIYKTEQSTIDAIVNFTDSDLLAAAQLGTHGSFGTYPQNTIIIFDNEIVNQDIFITHKNLHSDALECNYYIEMEVIPLDDAGAEYTTIKDLRSNWKPQA